MQNHWIGVNATGYDPRFFIQNYPLDPMINKK